jgi:hypothetical protein
MLYRLLADFVVLLHFAFVLFAVLGGLLVIWWKKAAWAHLPVVIWATLIELIGWVCPLTPLENWLRRRGGEAGYTNTFIEQYILPLLYPVSYTHSVQLMLGFLVLGINLLLYGAVLIRALMKLRAERSSLDTHQRFQSRNQAR